MLQRRSIAKGAYPDRKCLSSRSHRVHVVAASIGDAIVVEKKACDVLILGNSTLAAATAYSLARRQKKVVHLPNLGLDLPHASQAQEALRPLVIPDPSPHITRCAMLHWTELMGCRHAHAWHAPC